MLRKRVKASKKLVLSLVLTCSTMAWFYWKLHELPKEQTIPSTAGIIGSPNAEVYHNSSVFSLDTSNVVNLRSAEELFDPAADTDTVSAVAELEILVVTAILPVASYSLDVFPTTFASFLRLSPLIQEVVLLCPPEVITIVRDILRDLLTDEDDTHLDASIFSWMPGLGEGSAILRAARQVAADRVILFDSNSLGDITYESLELLSAPLLTPLPVGSRGFNLTGPNASCIQSDNTPKAAAFLIPPFSVATSLIPPHDLVPTPAYDIWEALGIHISRARFERIGGIAVSRGISLPSWCPSEVEQAAPRITAVALGEATIPRGSPTSSSARVASTADHSGCSSSPGQVVLLFGSESDLQSFSPAICRMQAQGYAMDFLLVSSEDDTQELLPRPLQLSLCAIEVSWVPHHAQLLEQRLNIANCSPTAIIASGLEPAISDSLYRIILQKATTLIQIPDNDLPYCDWMGSLSIGAWRSWAKPQLEISVITDDRPKSLARLLSSLSAAHYFGDVVTLRINIEQTAGPQTLQLISEFHWPYGPVFIHRRIIHGGLLPAVVESWYPLSNDSYGLMLEDDVELSPLFYAWVKMALLRYRYGQPEDISPQLFGISLYQQKILELRSEGRHRFNARAVFAAASLSHHNTPYLSQIPCSWGAVYFPEHWREFHDYLAVRLSGVQLPISGIVAPGVRSNKWSRSWKKYFIELAFLRGYVMLYPNYRDYLSLSTNHLEVGSHVKEMTPEAYEMKKKLYQLPLLRPANLFDSRSSLPVVETGLLDLPEDTMPGWNDLPVLGLLGLLTTGIDLQQRGLARSQELFRCSNAVDASSPLRSLICPNTADD